MTWNIVIKNKEFGEDSSQGMILSFEGIDASGKKTQSTQLFKELRSKRMPAEYLSFPDYDTAVGVEIKNFLSGAKNYPIEARHMLYSINRLEHKQEIEEWLARGRIAVINRYCESNIAYGAASGVSIEWLRSLESKMPQADYVFYLRATTKLSKERKNERDIFEGDLSFLERVSSVYDALAEDSRNWFTIDADDSIENIHYEIWRITEELVLKERGKSETSINMRFRDVPKH